MLFSIKSLSNIIPAIKDTFIRFPLPFICALGATLIAFLLLHDIEIYGDEFLSRCLAGLIYGAIALTSLKLLVESKDWSVGKHLVSAIVTTLLIIFYVWAVYVEETVTTYIFFSLAVILSPLFSPYIDRSSDAASTWYFNYINGVAVFFAGLAAIILGIGLSLILVSIGYLFDIEIPDNAYGDAWILSWGVLFSIYLLSGIARDFDYENESCSFPKGISFITNYILVPLMIAYMLILYAYVLKIIVQWELPRGNLGWMITVFGTIGIVTKLLAYPIRNDGTRLLALFDEYYYYALIIPTILLFMAIGVRIDDYGLTEPRYGVVLLGLWFSSVTLLSLTNKDSFHIKHVPMILAALALLASVGPWSAVDVSLNSQVNRFEKLLLEHNLLLNGQATRTNSELSFEDSKTLSSVADYLSQYEYRQNRVRPLFESLIAEAKSKDPDSLTEIDGKQFVELLGITYVDSWKLDIDVEAFKYTINASSNNILANVSGFDYAGSSNLYAYGDVPVTQQFEMYHKNKHIVITVEFEHGLIIIRTESGDTAEFDLYRHISGLREKGVMKSEPGNLDKLSLTRDSKQGSFKARLLLEEIEGNVSKDQAIDITNVVYVLMFKNKINGTD